jgi:hypothetical protein
LLRIPTDGAAQEIERGRIGPMQILDGEHGRLRPCAPEKTQAAIAASCRRRNSSGQELRPAVLAQRNVDQLREQQ